jgi:hypothetical protein
VGAVFFLPRIAIRTVGECFEVFGMAVEIPHEELVQLGDLCALATWTQVEVLGIRFSLAALGRDQLRLVHHLKFNPHLMQLTLGEKRKKGTSSALAASCELWVFFLFNPRSRLSVNSMLSSSLLELPMITVLNAFIPLGLTGLAGVN